MRRLLADIAFEWDFWQSKKHIKPANGLRVYMFHSLFESEAERDSGLAFPHEGISIAQFETFIQYSLKQGCRFITPTQLSQNSEENKPAILITFDDGYANNQRALSVLEKYDVPALFCISTKYIAEGKSFWWDALWRLKKGNRALLEGRKGYSVEENEQLLLETFGPSALNPKGDTDRPLSVEELKTFSGHPLVHLGNHSHSHPLFTQLKQADIEAELSTSQKLLTEWTGQAPTVFAYPNGSFRQDHQAILASFGFSYALTTSRANYPEVSQLPFNLGRVPLYGVRNIEKQLVIHANPKAGWWKR